MLSVWLFQLQFDDGKRNNRRYVLHNQKVNMKKEEQTQLRVESNFDWNRVE